MPHFIESEKSICPPFYKTSKSVCPPALKPGPGTLINFSPSPIPPITSVLQTICAQGFLIKLNVAKNYQGDISEITEIL